MSDPIIRRLPTNDPAFPESRIGRCALTGCRPQKLPFGFDEEDPLCIDLKIRMQDTLEMLILQGYAHFLCGGALGIDMFAAEEIVRLRERFPWIALEMVIPFDAQADRWAEPYRERYNRLLQEADIITYTGHLYTPGSMLIRNHYLVDHADLLLATWNGKPGGTEMTLRMARKRGMQITLIPPVVDEKHRRTQLNARTAFSACLQPAV